MEKRIEVRKVGSYEANGIFGKDIVEGGWAVFENGERVSHIHDDRKYVDSLAKKVADRQ